MNKDKKKQAQQVKQQTKKEKKEPSYKLTEEMENEIRDCFNFYDTEKSGYINRSQTRSILGNFGFTSMNVKEIEEEIKDDVDPQKQSFNYADIITIVSKKWFFGKGKELELDDMFDLFDFKKKGHVGINEIKNVFSQYLDIQISDADIQEFIQEADIDQDGILSKAEFAAKLGY